MKLEKEQIRPTVSTRIYIKTKEINGITWNSEKSTKSKPGS